MEGASKCDIPEECGRGLREFAPFPRCTGDDFDEVGRSGEVPSRARIDVPSITPDAIVALDCP